MQKALTKEDLLYILNSIFRISREPDNAFQMLSDGLYVEHYSVHAKDTDVHVDAAIKEILTKFTLDGNGNILYDNKPLSVVISSKEGNAITIESDGLYVSLNSEKVIQHFANNGIHVSEQDRELWNGMLDEAKKYTTDKIDKLTIYDIQYVEKLPDISTEPISSTTIYAIKEEDSTEECEYTWYININDEWKPFSVTKKTLDKYLTKLEIEQKYLPKEDSHEHTNLELLEKLSEDTTGNLMYNGIDVNNAHISQKERNAIQVINGELFVEDLTDEIHSMQVGNGFTKTNLLAEECVNSGKYILKESIDNFSLLLIEYYYRPDDETKSPGYAKTATVDVDTLNELYDKGIDYCLELGYGISNSNCKFNMHQKTLMINYYHNICIYKITGVGRSVVL